MGSKPLSDEAIAMREALFDEGVLDRYFLQIEDLEAAGLHDYVEEITTSYLRDSTKYLRTVEELLKKLSLAEFPKLEHTAYLLRGSSACIGAKKVKHYAAQLHELCEARDFEGAKCCLQDVKREHDIFRDKIGSYLRKGSTAGSTSQ